jgi:hypothetical protein
LQTLRAVTNETNRELTAARVEVTQGQVPDEILLDRALASIEHLSDRSEYDVADRRVIERWMAASNVNVEIADLTHRPADTAFENLEV